MSDYFDRDPNGTLFTSRRRDHGAPIPPLWAIVAVVILFGALWAGWSWLGPGGGSEVTPADTAMAPPESLATPAPEPLVLPALDLSDAVVRRLVETVSANPKLASWLVTDDLVRRFVESVVDLSRWSSPLPALEPLIPPEAFTVEESGDKILVDPRSYQRYDLLAQVFASVETHRAVEVYREILPLIQEAYDELGISERSWDETLAQAMRNVLAVHVPDGPLELREAVGRYVYADPSVEGLTPAAKHFYRMGPENTRIIQEKVREISQELGLPGS